MKFEIPKDMTFEQAIERLEKITEKLEGGTCSLAESLSLYEEGQMLSGYCQGLLNEANKRIVELSEVNSTEE